MKQDVPCCSFLHAHHDMVSAVKNKMPAEEDLYNLSELFKIFGDSTRVKILYVLIEEEVCVCDLAALSRVSVSAVSHQLRILKNARLVKYRKSGKTIFYSLADNHVRTILEQGMNHIMEK